MMQNLLDYIIGTGRSGQVDAFREMLSPAAPPRGRSSRSMMIKRKRFAAHCARTRRRANR